jgi:hypothetical protein
MTATLIANNVQIDLSRPVSGTWQGRGFGRVFVWHYRCPHGHTVNVRCNSWHGRTPTTTPGAIFCPHCDLD